jgi:hypothetical protein
MLPMKIPTVRALLVVIALAGAAFAQKPIDVPSPVSGVSPKPIEPPVALPSVSPSNQLEEAKEGDSDGGPEPEHDEVPSGPKQNFEFQGDEIGLVLRTLARQAKMNIVVSDKVRPVAGTVTFRIEDMTPREAIDVIVTSKGLVMDEVDGVFFIKTQEERAKEPTEHALVRTTENLVGPLAKLKGEYYRQLVQSGVPEATASTIVLNEELSKGAFSPSETTSPGMHQSSAQVDPPHSVPDWFTWTFVGSAVVDVFQKAPFLLLNAIFGIAVWATAHRTERGGVVLTFLSPFFWGFATLIGGVFVAGLYWLIHHSSLRIAGGNATSLDA